MTFAVDVSNLTKIYPANGKNQAKVALDSLSLKVKQGTIFGLLGPNGAGKSTLINILSNTVIKTSGSVELMGINTDIYPKKARRQIGVVPQDISIDTFFSLYQGLEFIAGYYGIKVSSTKIDALLTDLGLYEKRNNMPMQLSGGMKRRFMIAKSMIHEPPILILDEPTAGVDLELRNQLWSYVKKLNKNGVTIIITTHYLAEAEHLCDEIAFINNGTIVAQDKTTNLLDRMGTRYLDIILNDDFEYDSFRQNSKLEFSIPENRKMRFLIEKQQYSLPNIIEAIHKFNMPISDLKIIEPDLEDVFAKIINK